MRCYSGHNENKKIINKETIGKEIIYKKNLQVKNMDKPTMTTMWDDGDDRYG